jgi:aromatic ring-opening dioxygenase catalytic subunit (LigB family)
MKSNYDPIDHIKLGKCLKDLRSENRLIIGSGSSFHNLSVLGPRRTPNDKSKSKEFDDWLTAALTQSVSDQRSLQLQNWQSAPQSQFAHPREDHLVPLFVVAGAALDEKCERIYNDDNFLGGFYGSSYKFG